jgi:deoxyribose-phosphate aldolase
MNEVVERIKRKFLKIFDYGLVKSFLTYNEIIKACEEAKMHSEYIATISTNSSNVSLVANLLKGSDIKVCSTIAFPFGTTPTEIKVGEAINAIKNGAEEVDVVLNVSAIKSHDFEYIKKEINEVIRKVKDFDENVTIKAILETPYLNEKEKVKVCRIVDGAKVDFVKTSTGFVEPEYKKFLGIGQIEDIKLFKKIVKNAKIKASGGIRDLNTALALIEAGASRIGTSTPIPIIKEIEEKK